MSLFVHPEKEEGEKKTQHFSLFPLSKGLFPLRKAAASSLGCTSEPKRGSPRLGGSLLGSPLQNPLCWGPLVGFPIE